MSQKTRRAQYGFLLWLLVIVLVFIVIVVQAIGIQAEKDKWLEDTDNYAKKVDAEATRGNIFACDGRLLASSLPYYNVFWDSQASMVVDSFYTKVDSLALCLSELFKNKSSEEYKVYLTNGFQGKKRYLPIAKRVSYIDIKKVRQFPIFRWGKYKGGLVCEELKKRSNPFGYMAALGRISHDKERGTRGIEMQYDSLLKGEKGVALRQRLAGDDVTYNIIDPTDGYDFVTTIDVDIQDVAEKALRKKLCELEAKHGCAVLMEVATGEVKACVNLERDRQGDYFEGRNWSVMRTEPGSTFKTMSLIVALEDKVVKMSDVVDTKEGVHRFHDRDMKDSNWRKGGNGKITIEEAMAYSSNIGISRIIDENYGKNPSRYVNKLYEMGLTKDLRLEIPGYEKPNIRHPKDPQSHWYGTTLPWMSIGYESQVSPIYTLAYYNAIANNGKFIRPFFVKNVTKNGEIIKSYSTEVINEKFCSAGVLKDVRRALESVVEYGTGKRAHSEFVKVAGKTGTAQVGYGSGRPITHLVSFCGYFPADEPLYSCIVVIYDPQHGYASGGAMSGAVFKDIAEQVYARKMQLSPTVLAANGALTPKFPNVKNGDLEQTKCVLDEVENARTENWAEAVCAENELQADFASTALDAVPNVVGMGAKDAIYLMEKAGVRACISGVGKVVSQSLAAGVTPKKGDIVYLKLR